MAKMALDDVCVCHQQTVQHVFVHLFIQLNEAITQRIVSVLSLKMNY